MEQIMKMPTYEELTKEQDSICLFAPLDNAILVSGPPGSGKTVVAFYRAESISKKTAKLNLVMYNNVLKKYSSNASKNPVVQKSVNTWDMWFTAWHSNVFNKRPVLIHNENSDYVMNYDWDKAIEEVIKLAAVPNRKKIALDSWGALLIDEGQDFPKSFYVLADWIVGFAISDENPNVGITVFADDNQRLNPNKNSSIEEIETALNISEEHHYHLTKNYRNTYEIANVAKQFFCGLRTGIPDLPDGNHGNKPKIIRTADLDDGIQKIEMFVSNQSDLTVGVFLPEEKSRKEFFRKLEARLQNIKGVKVQGFKSGGGTALLEFDKGGCVTVLCDQSAKGLEFDAVFIPEMQARAFSPTERTAMKMMLYVLASRARTHLTFLYTALPGELCPFFDIFPEKNTGLLEWVNEKI